MVNPSILLHHGGYWNLSPKFRYVGGECVKFENLPFDIDDAFIKQIIATLGHNDIVKVHYLDPSRGLPSGLRLLCNDSYSDLFLALNKGHDIKIYTEHEHEQALTVVESESDNEIVELESDHDIVELESDHDIAVLESVSQVSFTQLLTGSMTVYEEHGMTGGDLNSFQIDYDEEGSDFSDEEMVGARRVGREAELEVVEYKDFEEELNRLENELKRGGIDGESDYEGLSDEDSPGQSSEEEECGYICPTNSRVKRKRGKLYREGQTTFFVNQKFDNSDQLKRALKNYCGVNGVDIVFTRNTKQQIGAKCRSQGCRWWIWASTYDPKSTSIMVKTYEPSHSHGKVRKVSQVDHHWVAEKLRNRFKINPYIKVDEIKTSIFVESGFEISTYCAMMAKKAAIELVVGEYKEQYGLLNEYAAEIKKADPNNTVMFKLDGGVFQCMYIGFHALFHGFKAGCRPFISVDGCFLKGPYGGQLLAAVGRDGNNHMYPLAWAVVQHENYESWSWFMDLLASDLGTTDGAGYVIMSDQQKGLLKATDEVFAMAEKRCCARHVYMNFRDVFGGNNEYRRLFWRISKSTTEIQFHSNLEQLGALCLGAAEDLLERNYQKWVRAFFTPMSSCDSVDNNLAEVFNAYILKTRHKAIISMLEDIREAVMERHHKKRDVMVETDLQICPRIQILLEKVKIGARTWFSTWDGGLTYGVKEGNSQERFLVDLKAYTCSCNSWQLSGIPCVHAVNAIWHHKDEPEEYLADYYYRDIYLRAYEKTLPHIRGAKQWEKTGKSDIIPPPQKEVKAHRPKTKRIPSVGEETVKKSRKGTVIKCYYCGEVGHNKKGCKLDAEAKKQIVKEKEQEEAKRKAAADDRHQVAVARKEQRAAHRAMARQTKIKARNQSRSKASTSSSVPMHQREYGNYTYSSGFSRPASMQQQQRNIAVYTDFEGQQTLRSVSSMSQGTGPPVNVSQTSCSSTPNQSFMDTRGRASISSQTLQERVQNRVAALGKGKNASKDR